ncbi:MAG TPA: hypothetical protein DCK95_03240 [Anaerolineaceae bacterium]|uniref:SH3b domain-containing protein n=1 Tax=Anaerolinea thermophila TaxID=167964 RepID=A0A124FN31_9CHLR|nr:MAG: hypothetical protein XD73_0446 [Anaerolinea thermophila]HAF61323.1 hypothetical protein [Anaerolineaceae bacterium]
MTKRTPLIVGAILGIGLFFLLLATILSIPDIKNEGKPTAILIITPLAATSVPVSEEGNGELAPRQTETALPGVFAVDMRVTVANTGGDGLKVHSEPDIESDTLTIASDGSVWIIIEGPTIKEGRVWWKMWSESSGLTGWAVQDYLTAVY